MINLTIARKVVQKWEELELKPKDIKFLCEYISNGLNATKAYLNSIARKGTCYAAAGVEAHKYLKKPNIKQAFQIWQDSFLESIKGQLEPQIIRHLMERAFYDIEDYYNENEDLIPLKNLTKEQRCVIDGIEKKYYGKNAIEVLSYKLADRDKARQELEKYMDMMKESLNLDQTFDIKTNSTLEKILKSINGIRETD